MVNVLFGEDSKTLTDIEFEKVVLSVEESKRQDETNKVFLLINEFAEGGDTNYYVRSIQDYIIIAPCVLVGCKDVGLSDFSIVKSVDTSEAGLSYYDNVNGMLLKLVRQPYKTEWLYTTSFLLGVCKKEAVNTKYEDYMDFERARLVSHDLNRKGVNYNPRDIVKWNEDTYLEVAAWLEWQQKALYPLYEYNETQRLQPKEPPEFLKPYVFEQRNNESLSEWVDVTKEHFCYSVRYPEPFDGVVENHSFDYKGDKTILFINRQAQGHIIHEEGGNFVGGRVEMRLFIEEGMAIDLSIAINDMFVYGHENAKEMAVMFRDIYSEWRNEQDDD